MFCTLPVVVNTAVAPPVSFNIKAAELKPAFMVTMMVSGLPVVFAAGEVSITEIHARS